MDPVSAASIGLAVVGLAAQCFSGAMQALQIISTARGLKAEYRYLTIRLRLEQQRCYNWAVKSGLLEWMEGDGDYQVLAPDLTGLNRNVILEVLAQMEALTVGFVRYKGEYGGLVPDTEGLGSGYLLSTGANQGDSTEADAAELIPDIRRFLAKARHSVSATKLPERVKWAVQDRDKYEKLVSRFEELNTALVDLVNSRLQDAIHSSTSATRLSVLQLHDKVDDLNQLIKALQPSKGLESLRTLSETSALPAHSNLQVADLARLKIVSESIEHGISLDKILMRDLDIGQPQALTTSARLSRSSVRLEQDQIPSAKRSDAVFLSPGKPAQPVWVEWKRYVPSNPQLQPNPVILNRIQKLAALLTSPRKPSSLRTPVCLGYFDDAEAVLSKDGFTDEDGLPPECRFGFVFLKPKGSSGIGSTSILSFHELIRRTPKPSLNRRVEIARAIAMSLLSLHSVNWLHKSLRSENILLACSHEAAATILTKSATVDALGVNLTDPYISGFDYARPSSAGEQTECPTERTEKDLYRHPEAYDGSLTTGTHFKKSFDIYSLGLVLAEVAVWRTIADTVLNLEPGKKNRLTASHIRQVFRESAFVRQEIEACGGAKYEGAVRACISGAEALGVDTDEDESANTVGVKLFRGLYEKVVRPLQEIQI